jgi:flagellar basal-body rod protein FlgF
MADGIYVGMAAAAARAAQLESVSDNLANAQSPGFKASRPAFQSFLSARNGNDKILSAAVATGTDLRPGATTPTDRPLDVIPAPDTFLAVSTPGGAVAYTRNGSIEMGAEGELTVAGNRLLDDNGQPLFVPPGAKPVINEHGEVFADDSLLGKLGTYKITGPIDRIGPTLMGPGAGAQVTAMEDTSFTVGALEMGNAPALEATIQMIQTQRHFETAMQAIQTYRKMDERAVEVGRIR